MLDKFSLRRSFLLALVVTSVALTVVLVSPFWTALLLAAVMAASLQGPMTWLAARLGGRREWSAGLLVVALLVALLIPVSARLTVIAGQAVAWWWPYTDHQDLHWRCTQLLNPWRPTA